MKPEVIAACLLVTATSTFAALPPLSPDELSERAEVVITGESLASRVLVHRTPSASTYLVRLSVLISDVEKGGALIGNRKGLDVRCCKMRNTRLAGPSGHGAIPADGATFRMWLRKNGDGHWEPLEPNGIELLAGSSPMTFAEVEKRELGKGFLVGGLLGMLGLGVLVWFRVAR